MMELINVEVKNQRVLTTSQLAESYETETIRIQQNFKRNKTRFEEGKHYIKLKGEDLKQFKTDYLKDTQLKVGKNAKELMLWTEKGALRHAKILDTDKAWDVYEILEETYFRVKENNLQQLTDIQQLQLQLFSKDDMLVAQAHKQLVELETKPLKEENKVLSVTNDGLSGMLKNNSNNLTKISSLVKMLNNDGVVTYGVKEFRRNLKELGLLRKDNMPTRKYDKMFMVKLANSKVGKVPVTLVRNEYINDIVKMLAKNGMATVKKEEITVYVKQYVNGAWRGFGTFIGTEEKVAKEIANELELKQISRIVKAINE